MTKDDKTFEENLLELENIVKEYRKKFDCGFTSNKITKFYLVKSNLYNKKDERIFRISYKDCYMKEH